MDLSGLLERHLTTSTSLVATTSSNNSTTRIMQQQQKHQLGFPNGVNNASSTNSSPNSSVDRKVTASRSGVQLSSATRERLWARSANNGPSAASNSAASGSRGRRLSGNPGYNNLYAENGYRSDSSINGGNTIMAETLSFNPSSTFKVEDPTISMKRYANSLESLDAVSCSIQQARAYSSQLQHHHVQQPPQKHYSVVASTASQRASGSTEAIHHHLYSSFASPASSSHNFQRTFPLRKSTSSQGHRGVNDDEGHSQPSTNWTSSSDRISTSNQDPFWTPTRASRKATNSSFRNGNNGYTTATESVEMQRLRRELQEEQERVQRLSAQLSTNAHVVSAFEHSLANMTSRLEQLNETSQRKDKELRELRHLINNLKEKNEKDCQDLLTNSSPRWKSDDNMLSLNNDTSTTRSFLSGKKNIWFRASFTKAFGRNKSSVNLSNDNETSSSVEARNNANLAKHRSISTSALDETIVDDLQRKLSAKDELLTETRLEALSSASLLQALREQVAKLRTELKLVKSENEELKQRIRLQRNSPPKSTSRRKLFGGSERSTLVIDASNLSAFDPTLDIPVIILISAVPTPFEIRIGTIRILEQENLNDEASKAWKDLDLNVQCLFGLYLARLDPFECLGLSGHFESYEFQGRTRRMLRHFEFIDDGQNEAFHPTHSRIAMKLKPLEELSFATLRPLADLKAFTDHLISTSGSGWIFGLPGCGKTFLAKRLAEYLVKVKRKGHISDDLVGLCHFSEDLSALEAFFANLSLRVKIVILDNVNPNSPIFKEEITARKRAMPSVIFLVTTSHVVENSLNWPILSLTNHKRLEGCFLGYLLRRRVLSIETLTLKANDSMIVAVNWLNRVYFQLLEFCLKHQLKVVPVKYFMVNDQPLESPEAFKAWFVGLWNRILVPELSQDVPEDLADEDPVQILIRTWPWQDAGGGLSQCLLPLKNSTKHKSEEDHLLNKDPLMDMLLCLQEATKESSTTEENPQTPNAQL